MNGVFEQKLRQIKNMRQFDKSFSKQLFIFAPTLINKIVITIASYLFISCSSYVTENFFRTNVKIDRAKDSCHTSLRMPSQLRFIVDFFKSYFELCYSLQSCSHRTPLWTHACLHLIFNVSTNSASISFLINKEQLSLTTPWICRLQYVLGPPCQVRNIHSPGIVNCSSY